MVTQSCVISAWRSNPHKTTTMERTQLRMTHPAQARCPAPRSPPRKRALMWLLRLSSEHWSTRHPNFSWNKNTAGSQTCGPLAVYYMNLLLEFRLFSIWKATAEIQFDESFVSIHIILLCAVCVCCLSFIWFCINIFASFWKLRIPTRLQTDPNPRQ